jgi:hypothetical protein
MTGPDIGAPDRFVAGIYLTGQQWYSIVIRKDARIIRMSRAAASFRIRGSAWTAGEKPGGRRADGQRDRRRCG